MICEYTRHTYVGCTDTSSSSHDSTFTGLLVLHTVQMCVAYELILRGSTTVMNLMIGSRLRTTPMGSTSPVGRVCVAPEDVLAVVAVHVRSRCRVCRRGIELLPLGQTPLLSPPPTSSPQLVAPLLISL